MHETTRQDGLSLKTTGGSWSSVEKLTDSYQWLRCEIAGAQCASIPKATHPSYTATSSDVGNELTVAVTVTDQAGQTGQAIATVVGPVTAPPPPLNTSLPVLSGVAQQGMVLKATKGSWESPDKLAYSYRWLRCDAIGADCMNIPNATGTSYKPTAADVGEDITLAVRATDQEGQSTSAQAISIGPVTS
jgi:hypothetical protein